MTKKYTLPPIPLKQGFANSGIKQRVPYQLPAADDDLNWLEGFTDAYQRPVIPDNLGEKSGRYVRMGQINQILENVSQAFLNVKQSLDNVSETIDKGIKIEIDKVITNANNALSNREVTWLQTIGNENCSGLKNFRDINIDNYKTKGNAVANLEWCNGMPLSNFIESGSFQIPITKTITRKSLMCCYCYSPYCYSGGTDTKYFINNRTIAKNENYHCDSEMRSLVFNVLLRYGDVFKITINSNYWYIDSYMGLLGY